MRICSAVAASPYAGMSRDNPNAAPPFVTTPTHWSSVSAVLTGQAARSAGGTSVRTDATGVPRASTPWQGAHQAA